MRQFVSAIFGDLASAMPSDTDGDVVVKAGDLAVDERGYAVERFAFCANTLGSLD